MASSSFDTAARAFFAAHAGLAHAWGQCRWDPPVAGCLRVPARDERGFDLEVHDDGDEITIFAGAGGAHFHVPTTTAAEIAEALDLLHDLLSPGARLQVRYAGRTPYRWWLEIVDGEVWRTRTSGVLPLFNYFGRRSSVTLQNAHLPVRELSWSDAAGDGSESTDESPGTLRSAMRQDGRALLVFGVLHYLAHSPGTAWSVVLAALGVVNLAVAARAVFVVNALAVTLAGLLNLSSPSLWRKLLAVVEFVWAWAAIMRFATIEDE